MRTIIELIVIIIIIYWGIKFLKYNTFNKVKKIDVEAVIEAEKMKMMNTIYARDFYKYENELNERGFGTRGIYIFTNLKNNKSYVGQSINILSRIRTHLGGRGNPELYRDIEKGNKFTIQLVRLADSEFSNLDSLEKHYISKHDSYVSGYNKTRGNG